MSLGRRPVVVLTAGVALTMPGVSDEGNAAMRRRWLELQGELAGLSTNSDLRIVEGAGLRSRGSAGRRGRGDPGRGEGGAGGGGGSGRGG